jgi:hypothetical protein
MLDAALFALTLLAQNFDQRGYIETGGILYPQTAPANDSAHAVGSALLRWDPSYKLTPWLTLTGSFAAAIDTHHQVQRSWNLSVDGRTLQEPAFALRRFEAVMHKGNFTLDLGRQFIRWGKADILNPTDRFAPKDYLASVVNSDFLGVIAARATYESGGDTYDFVWQPWFTPARTPLLNQRWAVPPPQAAGIGIVDRGARYPGGSQFGFRWNHISRGYEYSLSYFDGRQYLPSFDAQLQSPVALEVTRYYPRLRLYGADAAVPLHWFTVKGEAAYFSSPAPGNDEYALYVIQLERIVREWSFAGGYAGEAVTNTSGNPLQFSPERGMARSFVGRAALTIDVSRSMAVETAVRGGGSFVRFEYSQLYGQHWRTTWGAAWIRGGPTDFLGQYRRNSYASVTVRYSF